MLIGELAERTGVSARSLRYYEGLGLIRSSRTTGGWRDFDEATGERVVLIQRLFAAGLCSATIKDILPCLDAAPDERTGMLDVVLAREVVRLEGLRRDIDRQLEVLREVRSEEGAPRLSAPGRRPS